MNKIPSLDGLRAISIVLVLMGHLQGTRHFPRLTEERWAGDYASVGVTFFFVISGYLITRLLLDELAKTGTISLRLFYIRRGLRILPAFFAFLAAVMAAQAFGVIRLHEYDILAAITYTVNYHPNRSWPIGHLWSLSVEEQFYLIWPWTLKTLGTARSLWLTGAFYLGAPLLRGMMRVAVGPNPIRDLEIFPVIADGIAVGCLLAGLDGWLRGQTWYQRMLANKGWMPLVAIFVVLEINRYLGYTLAYVIGKPVMLAAMAYCVHWTIHQANSPFGRFLNSRPVVMVGLLSYSLYIWQQPFFDRQSFAVFTSFPLNLLSVVVVAGCSYFLLEKPFFGLRHKFHPRQPVVTAPLTAAVR